MDSTTLDQPHTTLAKERIELALKALAQIEGLLPIVQRETDEGPDSPDAVLGMLGRIEQMNDVTMRLLDSAEEGDEVMKIASVAILGRREANHA